VGSPSAFRDDLTAANLDDVARVSKAVRLLRTGDASVRVRANGEVRAVPLDGEWSIDKTEALGLFDATENLSTVLRASLHIHDGGLLGLFDFREHHPTRKSLDVDGGELDRRNVLG